jgi:hypothetical protein
MEGDLGPLTVERDWPRRYADRPLFIFMIVAMGLALMRFRRTLD